MLGGANDVESHESHRCSLRFQQMPLNTSHTAFCDRALHAPPRQTVVFSKGLTPAARYGKPGGEGCWVIGGDFLDPENDDLRVVRKARALLGGHTKSLGLHAGSIEIFRGLGRVAA
jgi:hypothetical protein